MNRLGVAHFIDALDRKHGGPSVNVVQLCRLLAADPTLDVSLYAQRLAIADGAGLACSGDDVRWMESRYSLALKLGLPTRALLKSQVSSSAIQVVHLHGLWLPSNHWTFAAVGRLGAKLALHPRGLLQPWALQYKPLRKSLAMAAYQRRDLQRVNVFFAASTAEWEGIRRLGFRQPVALIPNGVFLPDPLSAASCGEFKSGGVRTVLFLSRLHPSKGLDRLLKTWARLAPSGWRLRIVGEGSGAYRSMLEDMISILDIKASVVLVGPKYDEQKIREYQCADLFVLPTLSENFGVVVLEALACAVPVLTTRAAPWAELLEHGCGWWVPEDEASLQNGLREALATPIDKLEEMGRRGRRLAERYDWKDIARRTADVYAWMMGRRECPSDVVME